MKLIKWLFIGVGVLVVLVVAAGLILPMVIDPNDYRERIASEASKALDREVRLDGPLALSVFPWAAIELNEVSIANDTGFSAPHLLSVGEATVRVRLLPLLRGQLRVGEVLLRAPQVNLEIDPQGRSNWESLVSGTTETTTTTSSDSSQDIDLQVAGIQLLDASLSYSDAQADLKAAVTDFNLTSSAIDPSEPLSLDLSMNLAVEGQVKAALETSLEGNGLLDSSPMSLAVSKLSLTGTTEGGAEQPALPFSLTLSEPLSYTEADDALTAQGLVLESGSARAEFSLTGTEVSGDGQTLVGQLTVAEFNLRSWLAQAMGAAFQAADDSALTAFSSDFQFEVRPNRAALTAMTIRLDETTITGSADISDIERLVGAFQVDVDTIDVDRYLPEGETSQAPAEASEPVNLADLDLGQLTGEIGIGSLAVAGVSATDVKLKLTSGPEGVVLEPMNAGLYGGLLDTQIELRTDGQGRLSLDQSISGVQAGPLLKDFLGTQYMTGTGDLAANLTMDDPLGANPLAGANGTLSFNFSDGAIFGMDIFGALNRATALLNQSSGDGSAQTEEGQTTFSSMALEARVTDGVLRTSRLELASPVLTVNGDLTINLADMTVNGELEPVLLDATGLSGLDRIAGRKIPLSLSGDLAAPGISIDVAKLLLASQQEKIDQKKDELLGRLLGDDEEGDSSEGEDESSDRDRAKRRLLKSLLGDDDDDDGGN
ncbi:MAG: AsmA family protein [Pseudomonadota bacterium]